MAGDSLGSCHEIGVFATCQPRIEVLTWLKQRPVGTVAEDFQSLNEFAGSCHRVVADLIRCRFHSWLSQIFNQRTDFLMRPLKTPKLQPLGPRWPLTLSNESVNNSQYRNEIGRHILLALQEG